MLYRKSKHMFYIQKLFPPENRVVYDIMSKNMVEPERTQKMLRPRVSYWISKPTHAQARACAPAPIPTDTRKHIHTHGRTHTYACLHPHSRARSHTHTHTHTQKYGVLIAFHGNNDSANASQYFIIRTLPALL